jgi:hypothetical protein
VWEDRQCPVCDGTGQEAPEAEQAVQATTIPVSLKLLREAHAVMRACGWQLAPASDESDDPTLALAAAEIEGAFQDLLAGVKA